LLQTSFGAAPSADTFSELGTTKASVGTSSPWALTICHWSGAYQVDGGSWLVMIVDRLPSSPQLKPAAAGRDYVFREIERSSLDGDWDNVQLLCLFGKMIHEMKCHSVERTNGGSGEGAGSFGGDQRPSARRSFAMRVRI